MPKARIKLSSTDIKKLNLVCDQIIEIAKKLGAKYSGPIPLPTKKLKVPVRKAPSGQGSETYETWEMRIHKRVLDIDVTERAMRQIIRLSVPDEVNIEIKVLS